MRPERHNPASIATLRAQLAHSILHQLDRCPFCGAGFLEPDRTKPDCFQPTAEAGGSRARTSLRSIVVTTSPMLASQDVLSSTPARANPRAPRPDTALTHFRSPPAEKSGLAAILITLQQNYGILS